MPRLDTIQVYDIIIDNNLRTEADLFLLANKQKEDGKTDLLQFILKMTDRRRSELIKTAWRINNAPTEKLRLQKSTVDILREKGVSGVCVCNNEYEKCAIEVLENNQVDPNEFKAAVLSALTTGRRKGNNFMLIDPANCGKTFILQPLAEVFDCFSSPATGTFAWVGVEKAEIVFLNDLRWNEKLIPWSDFLNLLEGLPIHLPAPKTHFAEDIIWSKKTPIFATSSNRVRKYDGGVLNDVETGMMEKRWKYYEFTKPITSPKEITPCPTCFSRFIFG